MEAILKSVDIEVRADGICVSPIWDGVDRPCVGGYCVDRNKMSLALRLKKAIESGRCWIRNPVVAVDIYGKSYVSADVRFLMRKLNSELTKAGF